MNPNDDETRQFRREPQASNEPPRPERPRQFFPDPAQQAPETSYYQEPAYQQSYAEPAYAEPVYAEPAYAPVKERSNTAAVALGVIAGLATLAAVVFMFLWRGAAEEANQPPETVTITQTQTTTSTVTTTKRPSLFPGRGGSDEPALPSELPTELPTEVPPQVQDEVGGLIDSLLNEADRAIQGR